MPSFHEYHQPRAPNSVEEDPDADIDLPLGELNSLPHTVQSSKALYTGHQVGLDRLRYGRASRLPTRRPHRHQEDHRNNNAGQEEDLSELLHEDYTTTNSVKGLNIGEDNAPLLSSSNGRREDEAVHHLSRTRGRGRTARFFTRLRSSPQSEVEGQYDHGVDRIIAVGRRQLARFPPNAVSNAKYTPWSFLPRTLYNEFSFFFNLYFLLVALSQIITPLRIGSLTTYVAPLAFVLAMTLGKEAYDDITRRRRDAEANSERYTVLKFDYGSGREDVKKQKIRFRMANGHSKASVDEHDRASQVQEEETSLESTTGVATMQNVQEVIVMSRNLHVGDVLKLSKDQRVPADTVILKTCVQEDMKKESHDGGEAFIRTDQLDGETDWKLRLAPAFSQSLAIRDLCRLSVNASKPEKNVNDFVGTIALEDLDHPNPIPGSPERSMNKSIPLNIDNTAWANTVLASNATVLAVVVYTGHETRQALSTSPSRTKTGLLEYEINALTKILCGLTLLLSVLLVALEGFASRNGRVWYVAVMRFLILFSTIVPISLRVNLDLGKSVYSWCIQHDTDMPGTIVRTGNIPEDLGRIEYLLSDKTGTLTQNEMVLKKIHVGTVAYANEAMSEVTSYVRQGFPGSNRVQAEGTSMPNPIALPVPVGRNRRDIASRVRELVLALALCHNVTPTSSDEDGESITTYQASSPDEIAIVRWTESVGLRLAHRDRHHIILKSSFSEQTVLQAEILNVFPFTSDRKRMGIILRLTHGNGTESSEQSDPIWFLQKGADTVMSSIVSANDWLDEETANMAREGLRTLVVGRKSFSPLQYEEFASKYREASVTLLNRDTEMAKVVKDHLEQNLELLGVTGVEDKLQQDVKPSLELLRNAGIKIWMLTGDKVETARCVAVSSKLVARGQYVHTIAKLSRKDQALETLERLHNTPSACLLIDGESLSIMLSQHREAFISTAISLPAVVACRCSPTQKAEVASLIRTFAGKRICCIGDGGNDVSMIQAADVGVGIVGKEGRQASLAADFSILQFHYLTKLLVWHGRNSYKRSAKLAQFVIHRGLIISVCQAIYSIASKFEPIALYKDWLLVGYATVYTMAPVFSLVLDTDIPPQLAHLYPELYAELSTSRSLSYRTFFVWVAISLYQGLAIQLLSHLLVGLSNFPRMVSVSYSVLIVNELVMVAAEVTTWHWMMVACIVGTAGVYFGSLPFLGDYFDLGWMLTGAFWWRFALIAGVSLVPVYGAKIIRRRVRPPSYRKVQQGF